MESRFDGKLSRLILRFRGKGDTPLETAETAVRQQGLRVIDQSPRMLLLEGATTQSALKGLQLALPDWSISEAVDYSIPVTGPRVKAPERA